MLSKELKSFNIAPNDITTYFKKYIDLTEISLEVDLYDLNNLIVTYLNINKRKSIFGVLNIENEMYVLIYNSNKCEYGAIKIEDNDNHLFYDVIINYDNERYQALHEEEKIEEHGFSDIKNIYDSLPNNIRDIKFEARNDGEIQNYILAYIPVEVVEDNLALKDTNKNKFRCKYKVPLRLGNNNGNVLAFHIPTAHPLSKDNKNDFIIC